MRIKRFIAPDMRTALRLVRDEQGPDAVILSNRATAEGIEVVAATDYDEALVAQALRAAAPGLDASLPMPGRAAPVSISPSTPVIPQPMAAPVGLDAAPLAANTQPTLAASAPATASATPATDAATRVAADPPVSVPVFSSRVTAKPRDASAAGRDSLMSKAKSIFRRGDAVADGPTLAELTAASQPEPAPQAPTAPQSTTPAPQPSTSQAATPALQSAGAASPSRDSAARFEDMMAALLPPTPAAVDTTAERRGSTHSASAESQAAKAAAGATAARRTTDSAPVAIASADAAAPAATDSDADYLIAIATGTATPAGAREPRATATEKHDHPVAATALHVVASADTDPSLLALRRELATMRQLMEKQMDQLSLERLRGSPARAAAFECLLGLGCDTALAQSVAGRLDPRIPPSDIHAPMLAELVRSLPIAHGETIEDGGVIALVGPTGAGKTTTAAKLAARFAARHRARDVALVSIDRERTGAREQLHALGRRLGVTVCDAENNDGLNQALEQLADYPLVLVDTAGYGVRDRALLRQILWLRSSSRLRSLLVLPANAHPHDLGEIVRRYRPAAPEGVVLTKFDETGRPGAALSVLAQHGLPLAYACSGQQVPEDLEAADADGLTALFRAQLAEQRANDRTAHKNAPAPHTAIESGHAAVNHMAIEDLHAFA